MPQGTAPNGRHANGKFAVGNKAGKGNPLMRRMQNLRCALLRHVKKEDLLEVVDALLEKAKGGDLAAIRELLNRLIGRPALPVELSGQDGAPLKGPSLVDVQLVIIQALSSHPAARAAVADALHRLHHASNGNGAAGSDQGAGSRPDGTVD
jgi:hypothetical protein